ncbi:MAG TPA: branched-chain amino acid transaminase [Longimicrobiales bacterium]
MASSFPATEWIWKDGEFIPWASATLHVMSHVVHYGSSVFEGIRCYRTPDGPAIFRLEDHLRRLHDSARIYRMEPAHTPETLARACIELVRRNGLEEGYIRPLVLRGYGAAGINPAASPIETYLACWPWGAYLGDGALDNGVDVCVSSWHRPAPNTLPVLSKAGGHYLNSQLIKMEALANGFAEGIALAPDGLVSEGSGQNLFLVRDGTLITPPLDGTVLRGITRDCILTLARDIGIPIREQAVPREMLYTADELFFTGTAAEVTPIRSVDRIPVRHGVGPVTRTLQERLLAIARGTAPDPYGWRTPVAAPAGASAR